jgi:tetratricopeptide (TPR) repeat protein
MPDTPRELAVASAPTLAASRSGELAVATAPTWVATSRSGELAHTLAAAAATGEALERGAVVGRYVVLGRLGAGGMGVVYAAWDPELDRKVAVKLLRAEVGASADARTRLLREAQALARLGHPNVVAVHDAGSVGGRVWLAMEFVEGQTLTAWCAARPERRGRWREVLAVMLRAGRGLQAAHDAGLVHRDFKPDNVMVASDGRVRVMDLGLARRGPGDDQRSPAASGALALQVTQAGAVLGTPAYMAPEQFEGADVTPAADVFAFSVTLWEALYGERPFAGATVAELVANLTDGRVRAPPRGRRVPKWLRQALLRGLAVAPAQRWPGMQALLAALARGQARATLRVGAAALAALGACAGAAWGWQRAEAAARAEACVAEGAGVEAVWGDAARERVRAALLATGLGYAPATADRVAPLLDEHARAWRRARTAACLDRTADADARDRTRWCLEERRVELQSLVSRLAEADAHALQQAVAAAAGLASPLDCLDRARLARAPLPPAGQRDEARRVHAELARAGRLELASRYAEGLAATSRARSRAEALGLAPLAAAARRQVGLLSQRLGDCAAAERALEAAYFEALAAGAGSVAADAAVDLVSVTGYCLARHADGRRWAQHAEAALRPLEPTPGLRSATRLANLATVEVGAGEYAEARRLDEQALAIRTRELGPHHLEVARSLHNLGLGRLAVGDYAGARQMLAQALPIRAAFLGPTHPEVGKHLGNLAAVQHRLGQHADALALGERSLEIRTAAFGPDHPEVAAALTNLAGSYVAVGHEHRARALYEQALAIYERRFGPSHPDVAMALVNLANTLADHEAARALYARALEIREAALDPSHPDLAWTRVELADLLLDQGELQAARALYEPALRALEAEFGDDHAELAHPRVGLAEVALREGDFAEARALAERALARGEATPPLAAKARFVLARALWALPAAEGGDRGRAPSLARGAAAGLPPEAPLQADIAAWLTKIAAR